MQSANHTRASNTKQSAGIRRVWSNVTDTKRENSARVVKKRLVKALYVLHLICLKVVPTL